MDANTYEQMEAEESRVLKKANEENEDDVEYGAKASRRINQSINKSINRAAVAGVLLVGRDGMRRSVVESIERLWLWLWLLFRRSVGMDLWMRRSVLLLCLHPLCNPSPSQAAASATVRRTAGSISALSGAQGIQYMEFSSGGGRGGGGGGGGRKRKG